MQSSHSSIKSNDLQVQLNEFNSDLIVLSTDSSDTQSEYGETSSNQTKKRSTSTMQRNAKKCYEDQERILMERAISVMDQKSDEYDIFGQFVASELRQIFDQIKRNNLKRLIMNTLMSYGLSEQSGNGFTAEYMIVSDDNII